MAGCGQKKGLFGYCKKESVHPGDHDNGKVTWPRVGSDLQIYLGALSRIEEMRIEQRRLADLAARHERGEL